MKPTVQSAHRRHAAAGSTAARCGPHLNALKHGLRSGHVLLPGDDVAEFRKLRRRWFQVHQPRTIAEARCVETIVAGQWRIARCHLEQRYFKYHLGAAMSGHPDTAGSLCNPDLHRVHHRGTDCQREERRLEKSVTEAETTLALMQKQRTQNLTPHLATVLEPYEVFLAEGEPVVEEELEQQADAGADTPVAGPSAEAAKPTATDSADWEISIGPKRAPGAPARRIPKHWSPRRRRKAALQREAALRRAGEIEGARPNR